MKYEGLGGVVECGSWEQGREVRELRGDVEYEGLAGGWSAGVGRRFAECGGLGGSR